MTAANDIAGRVREALSARRRQITEADRRFNADLDALFASFKGRSFNGRAERELRARIAGLARQLYAAGGCLLDYRNEDPIFDPDQVHIAISFEHNEIKISITKKAGKPS